MAPPVKRGKIKAQVFADVSGTVVSLAQTLGLIGTNNNGAGAGDGGGGRLPPNNNGR